MTDDYKYGIKTVAIHSGLTQYTIRAWEKRYNAVTPLRTETNRRLYSDSDIYRLTLLRLLTEVGHRIGHIVHLPTKELQKLTGTEEQIEQSPSIVEDDILQTASLHSYISMCLAAIKEYKSTVLESTLFKASVVFSQPVFLEKLIVPLMYEIGTQWKTGLLRIAHEHLATAVIRTLLGNIRQEQDSLPSLPNIVIATPRGQLHEIGALMAGISAAADGWQVTYLGPNLPAEEIIECAEKNDAKAVGLSIIYPIDDPQLASELRKLRHGIQEHVKIFAGGAGANAYTPNLRSINAVIMNDLQTFRTELEDLRYQNL